MRSVVGKTSFILILEGIRVSQNYDEAGFLSLLKEDDRSLKWNRCYFSVIPKRGQGIQSTQENCKICLKSTGLHAFSVGFEWFVPCCLKAGHHLINASTLIVKAINNLAALSHEFLQDWSLICLHSSSLSKQNSPEDLWKLALITGKFRWICDSTYKFLTYKFGKTGNESEEFQRESLIHPKFQAIANFQRSTEEILLAERRRIKIFRPNRYVYAWGSACPEGPSIQS